MKDKLIELQDSRMMQLSISHKFLYFKVRRYVLRSSNYWDIRVNNL